MDRDGQHAGKRPEAEGVDEDQREDEFGHGAEEFERPPADEVGHRIRRKVARGEKAQGKGTDATQRRADEAHQDGFEQEAQPVADAPIPAGDIGAERFPAQGGKGAVDVVPRLGQAAHQLGEIEVADLHRADQRHGEQHQVEQRPQPSRQLLTLVAMLEGGDAAGRGGNGLGVGHLGLPKSIGTKPEGSVPMKSSRLSRHWPCAGRRCIR